MTELEKTPGLEMVIDQRPQKAAVCSAAAYESADVLGGDESQRNASLRRLLPNTKRLGTLCWLQRKATKQNGEVKRIFVPLCGLGGISLCSILSSSDAHMTCLDEEYFITNVLLCPVSAAKISRKVNF